MEKVFPSSTDTLQDLSIKSFWLKVTWSLISREMNAVIVTKPTRHKEGQALFTVNTTEYSYFLFLKACDIDKCGSPRLVFLYVRLPGTFLSV